MAASSFAFLFRNDYFEKTSLLPTLRIYFNMSTYFYIYMYIIDVFIASFINFIDMLYIYLLITF